MIWLHDVYTYNAEGSSKELYNMFFLWQIRAEYVGLWHYRCSNAMQARFKKNATQAKYVYEGVKLACQIWRNISCTLLIPFAFVIDDVRTVE
jgi:hypothetical protein